MDRPVTQPELPAKTPDETPTMSRTLPALPADGLIAVVKRDCPTCELIAPVLADLQQRGALAVYTQDDPAFPETVAQPIDDRDLLISHRLEIEVVPTLIRRSGGSETGRTYGWDRAEWEKLSGAAAWAPDCPPCARAAARSMWSRADARIC